MKIIKNYKSFRLYKESVEQEIDKLDIMEKITAAKMWLSGNKTYYADLLNNLNIYGSTKLKYKTMATNGRDLIFDPGFVRDQSDEAIRLVLMHETLHCRFYHSERLQGRNHDLWNQATDYAINAILFEDEDFGKEGGINWPVDKNGRTFGLYDPAYSGMRAEEIYEALLERQQEGQKTEENKGGEGIPEKPKQLDDVLEEDDIVQPDKDLILDEDKMFEDIEEQEGKEEVQGEESQGEGEGQGEGEESQGEGEESQGEGEESQGEGEESQGESEESQGEGEGQQPSNKPGQQPSNKPGQQPSNKPGQQPSNKPGQQPSNKPGQQPSNKPGQPNKGGVGQGTSGSAGKADLTKAKTIKGELITIEQKIRDWSKDRLINPKRIDWDNIERRALQQHGHTLSKNAKDLLDQLDQKPIVDWKLALRKFFSSGSKLDLYSGNKKYLGRGQYLTGIRRSDVNQLDKLVVAVDISSSISEDQVRTFLNEIMGIKKRIKVKETIVIYCNTDITFIDRIPLNGTFHEIPELGGGTEFYPPFEWLQKNRIKPNAFIYLTDADGDAPNINQYGIQNYANKVLWFICSDKPPKLGAKWGPRIPPFGKILPIKKKTLEETPK